VIKSSFPNPLGLLQPVERAVKPGWTATTLNDPLEKIHSANGSPLKLGEYDFRKFELFFEFIHLLHVLNLINPKKMGGMLSVDVTSGVTSWWRTYEWLLQRPIP